MKYAIYQIMLTGAEYDAVENKTADAKTQAKYEARRYHYDNVDEGTVDFNSGLYTHVANIDANDLEHVFHISNCPWDREELEPRIERLDRMHSVSVGDIVVDGNGIHWYCAGVGFEEMTQIEVAA